MSKQLENQELSELVKDIDKPKPMHKAADVKDYGSKEFVQNIYLEFVGSFLFAYLGQGAILSLQQKGSIHILQLATSQSLILAILIFCCIETSGGNFNPLVTFGLLTSGLTSFSSALFYIIAQVLGMWLANLALIETLAIEGVVTTIQLGGPSFGSETQTQCFLLEMVFSMLYIFIIHAGAADQNQAQYFRPFISPILVGLACFICIMSSSLIIPGAGGACFNPARALGPALASGEWEKKWIYVAAPAIAAIIHSSIYRMSPYKKKQLTL